LNSNFPKIGYIFGHGTLTFIYLKEHTRQVLEQAMKAIVCLVRMVVLYLIRTVLHQQFQYQRKEEYCGLKMKCPPQVHVLNVQPPSMLSALVLLFGDVIKTLEGGA
jgi:hypothetical protein